MLLLLLFDRSSCNVTPVRRSSGWLLLEKGFSFPLPPAGGGREAQLRLRTHLSLGRERKEELPSLQVGTAFVNCEYKGEGGGHNSDVWGSMMRTANERGNSDGDTSCMGTL